MITEYVDIAKAFYEDDAPGLVHAVLDTIAKGASSVPVTRSESTR